MRQGEGRLFEQLDAGEQRFFQLLEQQNQKSERAVTGGSGVN
jgi:hypothetical protein